MQVFSKALLFAAVKHQHQRRKQKGDIPYINHPIQVADILIRAGVKDHDILAAALLHDTVEDTNTTPEELQQQFGTRIKDIVMECTDNKELGKVQRKKYQIEKALKTSNEAKMVKIADKISNNRGLLTQAPLSWSPQRVNGYFIWSQMVCKNLAGVNEYLDDQIKSVFNKGGINDLSQQQKQARLVVYYSSLSDKQDTKK